MKKQQDVERHQAQNQLRTHAIAVAPLILPKLARVVGLCDIAAESVKRRIGYVMGCCSRDMRVSY